MGKRSRRERANAGPPLDAPEGSIGNWRLRLLKSAAAAVVLAVGLTLLVRSRGLLPASDGTAGGNPFTRVGRNGPVFTVSVPRARVTDDQYLLGVADQLSSEEIKAGGSGQISVMVWPDDVQVPKEPPANEFDASMKTQAAGIFINPVRGIKHMIRFRDGSTLSEHEFGTPKR